MEQPLTPARITIDFRDSIDPHRGWIVGVGDGRARVELITVESPARATAGTARDGGAATDGGRLVAGNGADPAVPVLAVLDCTCPEFCERDHANE
jgi:hypothetical protein